MVADGVLLTMWSKKNPYLLKNYGTGRPQLWNSFHIKTMFNILGGNTSAGSKDKGLWFQRWMGNQMRDIWSSPSNSPSVEVQTLFEEAGGVRTHFMSET